MQKSPVLDTIEPHSVAKEPHSIAKEPYISKVLQKSPIVNAKELYSRYKRAPFCCQRALL